MIELHNRYLNYISIRVKLTCREVELSKQKTYNLPKQTTR
jgi:hypothetical protein